MNRFSRTRHVSPVVITDGHPVCQSCCRSLVRLVNTVLIPDSTNKSQLITPTMTSLLYQIRNGLVAIPAAAYLEPVPICTRRFETRDVQIQCNTGSYSQTFFPSAIQQWNTLPVDICQLPPDKFQDPPQQFPFHLSTGLCPVFIVCTALHCFYPKVTVHCLLHTARLSQYTSAYSPVVDYCLKSSRRCYR